MRKMDFSLSLSLSQLFSSSYESSSTGFTLENRFFTARPSHNTQNSDFWINYELEFQVALSISFRFFRPKLKSEMSLASLQNENSRLSHIRQNGIFHTFSWLINCTISCYILYFNLFSTKIKFECRLNNLRFSVAMCVRSLVSQITTKLKQLWNVTEITNLYDSSVGLCVESAFRYFLRTNDWRATAPTANDRTRTCSVAMVIY